MSLPETCPGCQRAAIDVRGPAPACEDGAGGAPGGCVWRSLRQQAALTSAPWPDAMTAARQNVPAGTLPRPRDAARAAPAATPAPTPLPTGATAATPSIQQQLADEQAARRALREQLRVAEAVAAEAQAIRAGLFDELQRTRADLARARNAVAAVGAAGAATAIGAPAAAGRGAGPRRVDPSSLKAPPLPRSAVEASARGVRARASRPARLQLGLLALGAVIGIALGAGGVAWLRTSSQPPLAMQRDQTPPASQSVPSNDAPRAGAPTLALAQSAAQAADTTSSVAQAEAAALGPGPSGAAAQLAMAPRASAASPSVALAAAGANSPPPAELRARLQTALAAEGVAGAVDVGVDPDKVTVADPAADRATRLRTDTIIRAVYAGAQLHEPTIEHRWISPPSSERVAAARRRRASADALAANAHRGDGLIALGAPAAGRRPAALPAEAAGSGAPVETRPISLPVGRVTESCNDRVAHASLLTKTWVQWGCMRSSCCASASAENSEECQAYARTHPLNCPR